MRKKSQMGNVSRDGSLAVLVMQQYWNRPDEQWRFVPVATLAEAFKSSKRGRANEALLEQPFDNTGNSAKDVSCQSDCLSIHPCNDYYSRGCFAGSARIPAVFQGWHPLHKGRT